MLAGILWKGVFRTPVTHLRYSNLQPLTIFAILTIFWNGSECASFTHREKIVKFTNLFLKRGNLGNYFAKIIAKEYILHILEIFLAQCLSSASLQKSEPKKRKILRSLYWTRTRICLSSSSKNQLLQIYTILNFSGSFFWKIASGQLHVQSKE